MITKARDEMTAFAEQWLHPFFGIRRSEKLAASPDRPEVRQPNPVPRSSDFMY